ncbi:Uncharacterized protein SCF082_LOCUS14904 [Durusdinium trenchii]|uniref:C3H1-type domain-containing protein n=1 Tax=Durusdinium trenchii TaxID=1381693 RepID=A0ABP0K0W5_9DINO
MALRLFCTFIDVEEAEKDSVPTRRSRSQPCPRGSANAALDGESEYVATLLERSEATDFRALLTVQDAAEGEEAQTETGPPPVDPPDELGSSTSADEVAPSLGTVGHPVLCRRPCVRFMKGECTAGAACNYCHLQHEGLIMSLDKRQRQQIQNMAA